MFCAFNFYSYGEKGVQLVNITYVGDTLVATKATGDINVPRGEVTFTANLAPRNDTVIEPQPQKASFDPQSSTQHLPRYPGKGQIAKAGFVNSKYVEGQMVLFDNLFSFIWVPSRHHVLFRRPTSEQTIALLRNVISEEDTLENMRDHLERCFDMDMTESLARFHAQQGQEPFRRISKAEDLQAPNAGNGLLPVSFEGDTSKSFWQVPNWNQLMDSVLGEDGKNGKNNHGEAAWWTDFEKYFRHLSSAIIGIIILNEVQSLFMITIAHENNIPRERQLTAANRW